MLETRNVRPAQAGRYYSQDNYTRAESVEEASQWLGNASSYLALDTVIKPDDLVQMLRGFSPDGIALRHHWANQSGKEIGALDGVFSAPKSASLLAIIQGVEDVSLAHRFAVQECVRVAEERFVFTRLRVRQGLQRINTGNMAIAVFWHDTSRELDPHLHSHCLMMNCTYVAEKDAWYSLDNREIHHHKKWLGMLYQHELSRRLKDLGYRMEVKSNGQFELKGFTDDQLSHFSRRSHQIQPLLADASWRDRQRAAQMTRAPKGKALDKRELLDFWCRESESVGIDFPEPRKMAIPSPSTLSFYRVDSNQSIEDQERMLFMETKAPFYKIEEAIAVNLPMTPQITEEPKSTRTKLKELLAFNQVDEAIAILECAGHLVLGDDAEQKIIQDWTDLFHEQRRNSVLLTHHPKQVIARIKAAMEQDFGEVVHLQQRVSRPKSCLKVGDYVEPLRRYQKRALETNTFYQLKAFRRGKLELSAPDGEITVCSNDFQYQVWTSRDYPVQELEPLRWTEARYSQSEFAIVSVEENTALIQYQEGDLARIDIDVPLPIQSAIARKDFPPGKLESAYVLCGESLDLKGLVHQCRNIKLYGQDVKSIGEAIKTFIAKHDPIYSMRWEIAKKLEQEQPIGEFRNFGRLSAFRAKHRPEAQSDGIDIKRVSRSIRSRGQWRWLQRDERFAGAVNQILGTLQSKLTRVEQYRCTANQVCASLRKSVARQISAKLAPAYSNRRIAQKLTPKLTELNQSLHRFNQIQAIKRAAIASLSQSIHRTNQHLDRQELIAIAQDFRTTIPKSKLATRKDGGYQVETRSLFINVKEDTVAIVSKTEGTLAKIREKRLITHKLTEKDFKVCRQVAKRLFENLSNETNIHI